MRLRSIFPFLVQILILLPLVVIAQPGDPCPNPPCDPDVPITGIEFLLGGGALLGLRKIRSMVKSRKDKL